MAELPFSAEDSGAGYQPSGADLTFGPYPAANSGSECQIQKLYEDLYPPGVF
jgi:hypothetical protein